MDVPVDGVVNELESVDTVIAIMFNTKPNSNICDVYMKFVSFYAKCFYFKITMDVYKAMLINIYYWHQSATFYSQFTSHSCVRIKF